MEWLQEHKVKLFMSLVSLLPLAIAFFNWVDARQNMSWDESAKKTKSNIGIALGIMVLVWIGFMSYIWK